MWVASPVTRFTEMAPSWVIFWASFSEAFHLTDVRKLVQQAPHMDRQASPVEVVRLVAQQVEKLGVHEN